MDYWLHVDLAGNDRFPEALTVRCLVEWDGPPDGIRRLAADFYGVPLYQVGAPRETPLSAAARQGKLVRAERGA